MLQRDWFFPMRTQREPPATFPLHCRPTSCQHPQKQGKTMPWVDELIGSCRQERANCFEQIARFEAGEDKLYHKGLDESVLAIERLRKSLVAFDRIIALVATALLSNHLLKSDIFSDNSLEGESEL
ncbi:hypothetical protein KRR38_12360 [Novosphingobium sp. G106]|uniref:hypothetical protein n=1 Tax=Novosphingobium sp. G106 TaxID=2849500 RepID=UPI001C2CD85B|nr:hypothetical protein [Novosphingobium sp. G106]MBV1688445.1 hypothetical protein [Novosphingobium sp. G106]